MNTLSEGESLMTGLMSSQTFGPIYLNLDLSLAVLIRITAKLLFVENLVEYW